MEQSGFDKLCKLTKEVWLRLFLEMAFTYGWRKKQFLTLRVRQVNLLTNSIRLDVGTTKNKDGLEVAMTETIRELVKLAVAGKDPGDYLLTRATGQPVKDFRKTWHKLSVQAGLGRMVCRECGKVVIGKKCECGGKRVKYVGLILHDFRRSAARELRRAGVPESTIMDIGGWKTHARCSSAMPSPTRKMSRRLFPSENGRELRTVMISVMIWSLAVAPRLNTQTR